MNYHRSSLIVRWSTSLVATHQERMHGCKWPGLSENQDRPLFFLGVGGGTFLGSYFFAQLLLVPGLFLVGNNLWNNFLNKAWIVESTHLMLLSPVDTFHNFFGHFCWGNFFGNHLPTPTPSNCVIHIPANYSFAFWIRFFEGVLDCVISSFHLLS